MSPAVDDDRGAVEAAVRACYASWGTTYFDAHCGADAGYPPVHYGILRELLDQHDCRSLLDAGCGPASFLRTLDLKRIDAYGFDLTPSMVAEGRRVLAERGVSADRVREGSVLDRDAFQVAAHPDGVDAATCIGVLPHVRADDETVIMRNLHDAVRPGGIVVVEARNAFFSLFTLNRYTRDFILEELIAGAPPVMRDGARVELDSILRTDLPPRRVGDDGDPGYDEVLSRTHNPLVLPTAVRAAGLVDVEVLFYHYHCAPPMLQGADPAAFLEGSLAMEDPHDWRGYFMASAFLVAGRRP